MALTRKMLKAMGIEDEKIDQIIEAHVEATDALKEQRDTYKADAEKLVGVQKELEKANKALEGADKDPYKVKYEALKEDFDAYKTEQTAKATRQTKENAYRELLKAAGVNEKRLAAVLRVTNLDDMELDGDSLKDADKLTENIKNEWADFIPTTTHEGGKPDNPPTNNPTEEKDPSKMSMQEYIAYRNGKE